MTNKQLQQRTEQIIKSLGTFDDWKRGKVENPFPIGRTYAYNLGTGAIWQLRQTWDSRNGKTF